MEDGMYHSSNRVEQCLFEEQSASNAGLLKQDVLPVHREMPQPSCQPPQFTALQCYSSVFSSAIATSPENRDECFRVRFQVYCIDNGFEDPANSPDGLEHDDFDSHSVHSILTHNATGNAIGTVRLVLPDEDGERRMLPMRRIAEAVAADAVAPFPVWRTAEISRFSIVKSFRHYTPNQGVEAQLSAEEWRKMLFHLPLGLIKSCVEMSVREGMTHWAAVMESALLRLLTRLGIHFNPLGPLVEYHGRRQPCWIDLGVMLDRVHAERPDVWDVITEGGRLWPQPKADTAEATRVEADRATA
jgi:N-acyl amino acid synthase of PEP-CTERM/exosortase system